MVEERAWQLALLRVPLGEWQLFGLSKWARVPQISMDSTQYPDQTVPFHMASYLPPNADEETKTEGHIVLGWFNWVLDPNC